MHDASAQPILIAGPTASGKSGLALDLAERLGGVVINADSQQVYAEWRILTARPSLQEEAHAPHRLYGHVSIRDDYSVGHWLKDVTEALDDAGRAGQRPIIVGGTGLYFKALTDGLAPIPEVPTDVRVRGEAIQANEGADALVRELTARDPETAAQTDLANPRRVLRAWEVLEATGKGLAAWKAETPAPLLPLDTCHPVALTPDRDALYARCDARFTQMMEAGALDEVRAVMALDLPPETPGLKAVGAPELTAHLQGHITLDAAIEQARTETRRYAKRQLTWIRNQMSDWSRHDPADPDAINRILRETGMR
jgi:tRNA dimethylallyltransferase